MKVYSGLTFEDSATTKYNCHAYAWDGGTTIWMNDPAQYWEDGSYVKITTTPPAGAKVRYKTPLDHSAVTTSTPGVFSSKWGAAPQFKHPIGVGMFATTSSDVEYYVSSPPTYSAPSTLLCEGNTMTITADFMPPNSSWSSGTGLRIISTSGNSVTVKAEYLYYFNGLSYVGIFQNGKLLSKKEIWLGAPIVSINGPDYVNGQTSFCVNYDERSNPDNIYWMLYGGSGSVYNTYTDCSTIVFNDPVNYTGIAQVCNECDYVSVQKDVYAYRGGSSSPLAYPNPVDDILTVDIATVAQQLASVAQRQATTFDIRLYNDQSVMVRQTTSKGNNVQLNVANLPNGFYYLHVYDGVNAKPEITQIIVKH